MTITQADIDRAAKQTEILQRELDITNADHIALWLEASRPLDNALSWLACRVIEAHEIEMAKAELAHREAERRAIVEWMRAMAEPLPINGDKRHIIQHLAGAIERGEHRAIRAELLKGQTNEQ